MWSVAGQWRENVAAMFKSVSKHRLGVSHWASALKVFLSGSPDGALGHRTQHEQCKLIKLAEICEQWIIQEISPKSP